MPNSNPNFDELEYPLFDEPHVVEARLKLERSLKLAREARDILADITAGTSWYGEIGKFVVQRRSFTVYVLKNVDVTEFGKINLTLQPLTKAGKPDQKASWTTVPAMIMEVYDPANNHRD